MKPLHLAAKFSLKWPSSCLALGNIKNWFYYVEDTCISLERTCSLLLGSVFVVSYILETEFGWKLGDLNVCFWPDRMIYLFSGKVLLFIYHSFMHSFCLPIFIYLKEGLTVLPKISNSWPFHRRCRTLDIKRTGCNRTPDYLVWVI